jgi:AraC-like DNA-binding protein
MIDRRFDLEGVARKLNLGVRTLQRRLDRDGLGYRTILNQVRCQLAADLLAQTDHSVTEIALALGYEDPAHFSRAFARATSLPPSRYRQRIRRYS